MGISPIILYPGPQFLHFFKKIIWDILFHYQHRNMLANIRVRHTLGFVDYYTNNNTEKPNDCVGSNFESHLILT